MTVIDFGLVNELVTKISSADIQDSACYNVSLIKFKRLVIPFGGEYAVKIADKMPIKVCQLAWDSSPHVIEQYINIVCDKVISDYRIVQRELGRDGSRSKEFMISQAHLYGFTIED